MDRSRLPEHIRSLIPADQQPKPRKKTVSGGAGILARAGVGSQLELALLTRILRAGLPEPITQHRFHPTRRWQLDFAWPAYRLAVEVEGGIYRGGAHTSVTGLQRDIDKSNALVLLGWRLLRFHNLQIKSGEAVRLIAQALAPAARIREDDTDG